MKQKSSKERGQALIIIALAAIALFGIAGLAIDGSIKFSDRRHAQNAADAAALAAALSKGTGADTTTWKFEAKQVAYDNGYKDTYPSNEVHVYSCQESGSSCGTAYAGNDNYVQVLIISNVNTYFAKILGIQQTHNTVQAVAFTQKGEVLGDGAMLISYDPHPSCGAGVGSGGGSVDVSGSSQVTLNGGGIFLNSQENCGYATNCPDLQINGGSINTAAPVDNIDQDGCAAPVPENYHQTPVTIPDDIYWPGVPPECNIGPSVTQLKAAVAGNPGDWLIHPGYYEEFPPTSLVSNKQNIYMESGVYCIDP